jgi:hypothetical protein
MTIESMGNVPTTPESVQFDIYDAKGETLLERTDNKNRLVKVSPFETKDVTAELPTWLPPGSYLSRYKIIGHEGQIVNEGELNVSILKRGRLAGDDGYGFVGLSISDQASVVVPAVLVMILLIRAIIVGRRRRA